MKDQVAALEKWRKDLEKLLAKALATKKPATKKTVEELREEYEAGEITLKQYEKLTGATVNHSNAIYIRIVEMQIQNVEFELERINQVQSEGALQ